MDSLKPHQPHHRLSFDFHLCGFGIIRFMHFSCRTNSSNLLHFPSIRPAIICPFIYMHSPTNSNAVDHISLQYHQFQDFYHSANWKFLLISRFMCRNCKQSMAWEQHNLKLHACVDNNFLIFSRIIPFPP